MGSDFFALTTICGTLLLGAMSPGPSFILVARTAVVSSRTAALAVALGMGVGCMIFAVIALAGLHSLLSLVPWLYTVLKVLGGLYLIWLAIKIAFRSPVPFDAPSTTEYSQTVSTAFLTGLMTQLSNPNTALVFAGIFAATLSTGVHLWMYITLPCIAFIIDVVWYGLVAFALSRDKPRHFYLGYRRSLDKLSGALMAALGLRLLIK